MSLNAIILNNLTKLKKYYFLGLTLCLYHFTLFSQVNPTWGKWIKNNSFELSITDTVNLHDLSFLKQVLKDKKIVFLGENSHGVSEFTLLKSRIIRYLHDSLGFDVLVFESNAADAFAANMTISTSDVHMCIYNSISWLWHVEEIVPLFNFIKESHATKNPLNIAGVDITMSNGSYSFSHFLYNLISPINSSYAKEVQKSDSMFSRIGVRGWSGLLSRTEKDTFKIMRSKQVKVYSDLINFINKNKDEFTQSKSQNVEAAKFYLQSRIDFIYWYNRDSTYMGNKLQLKDSKMSLTNLFANFRDFMMSQNLKFLSTTLYPGKKIIVWAQDSHVKKRVYRMATDSSYSKLTYTIGLFCYSGKGHTSDLEQAFGGSVPDSLIYEFKTPSDSLSIESILHSSNYDNTFVDMLHQDKNFGNSWMFETTKYSEWEGKDPAEINNIRNAWDGLILVNKISPPKYLKYDYEYLKK